MTGYRLKRMALSENEVTCPICLESMENMEKWKCVMCIKTVHMTCQQATVSGPQHGTSRTRARRGKQRCALCRATWDDFVKAARQPVTLTRRATCAVCWYDIRVGQSAQKCAHFTTRCDATWHIECGGGLRSCPGCRDNLWEVAKARCNID